MVLLAVPSPAHATVVSNQVGEFLDYDFDTSSAPNASQIFTDFPGFDSMAVDDFTVTAAELHLGRITALFEARAGFESFQELDGYQLSIFSDPTLPGHSLLGNTASVLVTLAPDVTVTQLGGGDHGLVSLAVDIMLPAAGTYWLGIAPVSSKSVAGQFYLQNNGAKGPIVSGGSDGFFANPDEGYGIGPLTDANLDFAYVVQIVPEPAAAGLLVLGGLGLLLRRRRVV
jgi:hypothetical protein